MKLDPTFGQALDAAERSLVGMWVCSCSPVVAEICFRLDGPPRVVTRLL